MARRLSIGAATGVASLGVALIVLGVRWAGWLERIELVAFDVHQRWSAASSPSPSRVAMVDVTEEDIQRLGTYPLPDRALAQTLARLGESGAVAIGVDIYRDIPVPPGSAELAREIAADPRIVFPSKLADAGSAGVAGTPGAQVGFNNMVVDPDGVARRGLLMMDDGEGGVGTSFALLLALYLLDGEDVHLGPDPEDPARLQLGPTPLPPVGPRFGAYADIDAGGYQILLDCRGIETALPSTSLSRLLDGRTDPDLFRDRVAIVGVAADSIRDAFHVPCQQDELGGATLHGLLVNQLVRYGMGEGRPIRVLPEPLEAAIVIALVALGGLVGARSPGLWRFAGFGALGIAAIWLLGALGLYLGWWLPSVPSALGFAASAGVVTAFVSGRERSEKAHLMQIFARHVDAQIAEEMWRRRDEFLEGGRPRPLRMSVTVLFVDIRGYTSRAEKMEPEDLVVWLDSYLAEFAGEIMKAGGFVVDYFGDGIMACFGVPVPHTDPEALRRDAEAAAHCALRIESAASRINDTWTSRDLPPITLRLGIASGTGVAGNLGSDDRLKYGIVGDVVNSAQRLESTSSVAHDFDTRPARILISGRTQQLVAGSFRVREVGDLRVQGKSEAINAYQLLGPETPNVSDAPEPGGGRS